MFPIGLYDEIKYAFDALQEARIEIVEIQLSKDQGSTDRIIFFRDPVGFLLIRVWVWQNGQFDLQTHGFERRNRSICGGSYWLRIFLLILGRITKGVRPGSRLA